MSRVVIAMHGLDGATAIGLQLRSIGAEVDGLETNLVTADFPSVNDLSVSVLVDEMIRPGLEAYGDAVGVIMLVDATKKRFRDDVADLLEAVSSRRCDLPVAAAMLGPVPPDLIPEMALVLDRRPVHIPTYSIDVRSKAHLAKLLATVLFQAEQTLVSP